MDKSNMVRSMFGFTRGDSNLELPPLSPAQQRNLVSILNLLDEADPLYVSRDTRQYIIKLNKTQELHGQSGDLFPARDLRLNLLNSTIKAYEDVGVLLVATDMKQYEDSPDPTAAAGRIRKEFLKQVIEERLDVEGQGLLDYLLGR